MDYKGGEEEGGGDDITSAIGRYLFDCLVVEMCDNRFKLHSVLSMYMYSKVCYMEWREKLLNNTTHSKSSVYSTSVVLGLARSSSWSS